MSKFNKIYYGPAGTGKTRKAIINAVKIINEKFEKNIDINNYNEIQKEFKVYAEVPDLPFNNEKLIKEIQDISKTPESIVKKPEYEGFLKQLTDGYFDMQSAKEEIIKYRENFKAFPLIETVTFHPSYSYQDFVEGIGIETVNDQIFYTPKDGIFKKICNRAINNPDKNYILIIDEINRGDISSIFGELFTLLEDNKRKGENEVESLSINLPYSKDDKGNPKKLEVPDNLYILATMNTVDKSIALIDVALRRRFEFIECLPEVNLEEFLEIENKLNIDISRLLKVINERISILKNEHYQIGHSYFLNIENFDDLKNVITKNILPLLQEYFYDDWKSICAVLNQSYKFPEQNKLLVKVNPDVENIFNREFNDLIEYRNKDIFRLKEELTIESFQEVYER